MKVAYPAGSAPHDFDHSLLALKIARHSSCSICPTCTGLHPPQGVRVVMDVQDETSADDYETFFNSDDDEGGLPASSYLETCACGHDVKTHNANEKELGKKEFLRRSSVAIRIDELLKDSGRFLDFEYADEDIKTLRKELGRPFERESSAELLDSVALSSPSSSLSELDPSSTSSAKRRRASTSSLSDADVDNDDSDEEDTPLALGSRSIPGKAARPPGRHGGKASGGGKKAKKVHTFSGTGDDGDKNKGNGSHGHTKVKEEKADSGAPTDAMKGPALSSARTEKMSSIEYRRGVIQIVPVENDGKPRSLIILTGLKNLFQKQLPVMPGKYIARLVYDDNSRSLAIVKKGFKVVGGICFRPFPHRGFAEIVFFATNSIDQDKGYGGMLMDHFKAHIRSAYPGMDHFLTYADNYAVGYFEKQGFTKEITLEKSVWAGYIKDYDGGTIMQCTMIPKVDYLDKKRLYTAQQDTIIAKIKARSRSHIVYPGLAQFQPGQPEDIVVDPKDVPGLKESGWTPDIEKHTSLRSPDYHLMEKTLAALRSNSHSWPFHVPVKAEEVPDYYDVIKNPMDFQTMEEKLVSNQYKNIEQFVEDALLIFDNCRAYNPEASRYYNQAEKMEKFLKQLLPSYVQRN